MSERIPIASDHAGYELKERLEAVLTELGYDVEDLGTHSPASTDYPDYAHPLAEKVQRGEVQRGVLLCGTGNGMAYAANRHREVRAAHDPMALGAQRIDFVDKNFRVDHHAITDDTEFFGVQRARRYQMEDGLFAVDYQGVAGIIAALITDDDIRVIGKKIDDFAFAFIAPLGSDNCDVGHFR